MAVAELPQDTWFWGSGVARLWAKVPQGECSRLCSADPRMRERLAAEPDCSPAAMCLLVGDDEPVRLALAGNANLTERAHDALMVAEATREAVTWPTSVQSALLLTFPGGFDGNTWVTSWNVRYPASMGFSLLRTRHCHPEVLRLLWRMDLLQPAVAVQRRLPPDLVLGALTHRAAHVRSSALVRVRRWSEARQKREASNVLAALAPLRAAARKGAFVLLPTVMVAAAAEDPDPRLRFAAAGEVEDVALLRQLSSDSSAIVRRAAARRIVQLI